MTPKEFTAEEEKELREFGDELAGAQSDPFLPRCIVETFSAPEFAGALAVLKPLTFRSWFSLEEKRSPFLIDDWVGMRDPERLAEAVAAISCRPLTLAEFQAAFSPDAAVQAVRAVRALIRQAFSVGVKMRKPGAKTPTPDPYDHGFGDWATMLVWCCEYFRRTPAELMDMRVGEALLILSTSQYLAGKEPVGADYRQREIGAE